MITFWDSLTSPGSLAMSALPLIADAAIKGAIVIGLAGLVVLLLRRRSAATRHAVWAGAVVAQLTIPALSALLPAWRVPLLPEIGQRFMTPPVEPPSVAVVSVGGADMADEDIGAAVAGAKISIARAGRAAREARIARAAARAAMARAGARAGGHGWGHGYGHGDAAMEPPVFATPEPAWVDVAPSSSSSSVPRILAVVWLVGCLAIFGRFVAGTFAVWRLSRSSERVAEGPWLVLTQRIANALGVKRPLTLLRSGRFGIPVTWGVVYPTVLLPADANDWHEERRQYVLVHEMAHVKRVDAFTQLVAQLALAIFWFNPLVWLAVHRMRVEREHACDDYVLRQGTAPSTYASDLLEMVRTRWSEDSTAQPAFAALAMARPAELEERMIAILDPEQDRQALPNAPALATAIVALALLLPLAAINPFAAREAYGFEPAVPVEPVVDAVPVVEDVVVPIDVEALANAGALAELQKSLDHGGQLAGKLAQLERQTRALNAAARSFAMKTRSSSCRSVWTNGRGTATSIHVDDEPGEGAKFQFAAATAGRCLEVTITGTVTFTPEENAVRTVSERGRLFVREQLRRIDRELLVTRGDGAALDYDYAVDGRRTEFDEAGRAWLATVIPEILRESGLNAKERVARIRRDSGVRGVLAEIERTNSTGAKRTAYTALLDQGELSDDDLEVIVKQASRDLASSDGEMRAVLEQIARSGSGRFSTGASNAVGAAVARMSSDGERRSVLQQYASRGDHDILLMAMHQAKEMSSDGDKAGLLRAVVSRYLGTDDEALRSAFFEATESFSSDGERRSVLTAALPFSRVSPRVVLGVIESARKMSSDGDKAEVLVALVQQRALTTPTVREAFMRATRTLSSDAEYRRVMEVALQQ